MCACRPNVRTPNCGSMACNAAAFSKGEIAGLNLALEIIENVKRRTVGGPEGILRDAFREAYDVVGREILSTRTLREVAHDDKYPRPTHARADKEKRGT